ncbi:MAG: hypothetical protein AAF585_05945 [Verrucomicrobiota bacterium]
MIRTFLNGRFANTAFCILDPNGEERLTRSGRAPVQALAGFGASSEDSQSLAKAVEGMNRIASEYEAKGADKDMTLQDFHTFRQALNVASGDQRLLLFVVASETERAKATTNLREVMSDGEIIGKFHVDIANPETDAEWGESISDEKGPNGFVIIHADQFGLEGTALNHLPLTANGEEIKKALLAANEKFAEAEKRKDYGDHLVAARRGGVFFENEMPYGEDRDGDGQIDNTGRKKGKGKGKK